MDRTTLQATLQHLSSSLSNLIQILMSESSPEAEGAEVSLQQAGATTAFNVDPTALPDSLQLLSSNLGNLRQILMSGSVFTCYMNPITIKDSLQILNSSLEKLRQILMSGSTITPYMDPTTLQDSLQLLNSMLENLRQILMSGSSITSFVDWTTLQRSLQLLYSNLRSLRKTLMSGIISEIHQNEGRENLYPTQTWKANDLLQNFTQLLLLQKPCPRGGETFVWKTCHKYKGKEKGHLIEIQDLFCPGLDTQKEPQLVVLEGAAGTGKSTLARQVRREWEDGQLYRDRFQHVFYFSCRELAQCKQLSLGEFIAKDQTVPAAPIREILSHHEKLLFILDGIDEPEWVLEDKNPNFCLHWSQPQHVNTLLGSLLGKSVLPQASLLLTARTTVLKKFIPSLGQPRWVEVLGFSKSGRRKYIYKYFTEEREAMAAFNLVKSNPVLSTLCVVPWVSWLVCTCLKQQMDQGEDLSLTSRTTTELCLKYLSQALSGHALGYQLRDLCSLAAEGICRRRTLFSERDFQIQGLDDDDIATFLKIGILQKQPGSLSFSFAHEYLQEFFAALFHILENILLMFKHMDVYRTVETLKKVYGKHDLLEAPIVHFLFGLLSKKGKREVREIFACSFLQKTGWYLPWYIIQEAEYDKQYPLGLLHCLYETQDTKFLMDVMRNFPETRVHASVDMQHSMFLTSINHLVVQTDVELMVFTFCIKFCHNVKRLQLDGDGKQGQILVPSRMVVSRWTPITNATWQILFSTLEFTGSLKELDLSGNPLSLYAVRSLCRTLRCPGCQLRTLWLVNCGLKPSFCKNLASVLPCSAKLAELDLQLNDLGDHGVRLLCKGLRSPACNLRILRLDLAPLSDPVIMELRALEAENPQLLISSTWKPHVVVPTKNPDGEDMDDSLTTFKQQRLQSEQKHMEELGTEDDFWGPIGPVTTEVVDREKNLYRVQFPVTGTYHCPNLGLHFVVIRAVNIELGFCAWSQHLDKTPLQDSHMVAGPLLDIKAEQGTVAAVYLPHFVDLQEGQVDISWFRVAHFQEHGMVLEVPARVEQCYTVLENPSFSPMGVLLRLMPAVRHFIPITSVTLIYYYLNLKDVTLHLYLIPNDWTIQKAVDEQEMRFQFVRIHKPPPVDSLYIGSRYIVSASKNLEIIPKELELCYRSHREAQLFSEILVGQMDSEIKLQITDKKNKKLKWEALLKPDAPVSLQVRMHQDGPDSMECKQYHPSFIQTDSGLPILQTASFADFPNCQSTVKRPQACTALDPYSPQRCSYLTTLRGPASGTAGGPSDISEPSLGQVAWSGAE
uniref:NACHT, LRR and PYD domains-containing protein 1a-like isoform X4 n=2 Tax=Myodes glareolus TaxID=447135 RepID=UPI0020217C76|nr:NACHT, LRR and PYD domains-containing protein 1a-like isoform X4 [Myodes glareolus]